MTGQLPAASPLPGPAAGLRGADILRVVLGAFLLATVVLKVHQFSTEPVHNCAEWRCRRMPILAIDVELALGLWLVSGLLQYWARLMAGVSFGVFACIALYQAIIGEPSCGCFGRIEVSPWFSLGLDVVAIAALMVFRQAAPARADGPGPGWLSSCPSAWPRPPQRRY